MKTAIIAIALFAANFASADIIKCSFTEPFLDVQYSMTQSKLTINSPDGKTVMKNISFQILGAGQFQLWDKNNKMVMSLTLDNKGSDGMSDITYPYTAVFADKSNWANGGVGGCSSNFLAATPETLP